jgi:hypothetical protein
MSQITNTNNLSLDYLLKSKDSKKVNQAVKILAEFIAIRRESEESEQRLKQMLKDLLKPAYFTHNEEVDEEWVEHTFDVGQQLQFNFVNAYVIHDQEHVEELLDLLGDDHPLADEILENTKITLDVTDLELNEQKSLAKAITKLAYEDYRVKPEVERQYKTSEEFHTLRHVLLTAEDNMELDEVLPVQIQVNVIE